MKLILAIMLSLGLAVSGIAFESAIMDHGKGNAIAMTDSMTDSHEHEEGDSHPQAAHHAGASSCSITCAGFSPVFGNAGADPHYSKVQFAAVDVNLSGHLTSPPERPPRA